MPEIAFDAAGLVPVVAQQHDTGEVLMLAWMNREAMEETLRTGRVCYFSRSRNRLWRKGETSGQTQRLVELRVDCDRDAVLLLVDQHGVACHTGRRSCFLYSDGRARICRAENRPGGALWARRPSPRPSPRGRGRSTAPSPSGRGPG